MEGALEDGGAVGAANWSEVAQKVVQHGRNWPVARALLLTYDVVIEPVTVDDAEWAAAHWQAGSGLSLADRLCLALAHRTAATVWTADDRWGGDPPVRQVRPR